MLKKQKPSSFNWSHVPMPLRCQVEEAKRRTLDYILIYYSPFLSVSLFMLIRNNGAIFSPCYSQLFILTIFILPLFRWSAEFGVTHYGCPDLHEMLAEYMYSQSPELVGPKIEKGFLNYQILFIWRIMSILKARAYAKREKTYLMLRF